MRALDVEHENFLLKLKIYQYECSDKTFKTQACQIQ